MFARRDWRLLGLILAIQCGLVTCYFGVQAWNHHTQQIAQGSLELPGAVLPPLPHAEAPPAVQDNQFPETDAPPEAPGSILPASLNQSAPVPDPAIVNGDTAPPPSASTEPASGDPLPPIPITTAPTPEPGASPPEPTGTIPPVAPNTGVTKSPLMPLQNPAAPVATAPDTALVDPPVPPTPGSPQTGSVPPVVTPAQVPPATGSVPPPVNNVVPPPGPGAPTPPNGILSKEPIKDTKPAPHQNPPEAPPANGPPPSGLQINPPIDPNVPIAPPAPTPTIVWRSQVKTGVMEVAPSTCKKTAPPARAEGPCPWQFQVAIVNQRTVLTARTDKGATFEIRCNTLNLSRPAGTIEATGNVQIKSKDLQGSCERVTIAWDQDSLFLVGNANLQRWANGELLRLTGPQLEFHLSSIQQPASKTANSVED